jgi:hypothetical protein
MVTTSTLVPGSFLFNREVLPDIATTKAGEKESFVTTSAASNTGRFPEDPAKGRGEQRRLSYSERRKRGLSGQQAWLVDEDGDRIKTAGHAIMNVNDVWSRLETASMVGVGQRMIDNLSKVGQDGTMSSPIKKTILNSATVGLDARKRAERKDIQKAM